MEGIDNLKMIDTIKSIIPMFYKPYPEYYDAF
mgnify:CR=1 FL=1|jgi:hypothetical protein